MITTDQIDLNGSRMKSILKLAVIVLFVAGVGHAQSTHLKDSEIQDNKDYQSTSKAFQGTQYAVRTADIDISDESLTHDDVSGANYVRLLEDDSQSLHVYKVDHCSTIEKSVLCDAPKLKPRIYPINDCMISSDDESPEVLCFGPKLTFDDIDFDAIKNQSNPTYWGWNFGVATH